MSVARWIQCEDIISRFVFLSKHPTTGKPIASLYISMHQTFLARVNRIWSDIFSDFEITAPQTSEAQLTRMTLTIKIRNIRANDIQCTRKELQYAYNEY